ncbi:hypothetical protein [Acidisoma sp.]|uniref:hypothetical protein n=1 Tax=Acidisoma sp. TaxID=1872115 RepID=UPI003B00352F
MILLSRCLQAACVILPLTIGGCSMMGAQSNGSPTNGGVEQTTGLGSNGPASGSGGPGASAASHG